MARIGSFGNSLCDFLLVSYLPLSILPTGQHKATNHEVNELERNRQDSPK